MGKPSNITVILPYKNYPAKNGGEKFNALSYQYLAELMPVTVILTKNNVPPTGVKPVFLLMMGNSRLRYIDPFLFFKVRNTVKKNKSTHLTLIHPYFGWLGILIKWFTNVKLVIHSHNIESLRFKSMGNWWWKMLWYYEKTVHSFADINFFITEEDRQYGITTYKLDPEKCFILTYGIELTSIPSKEERETAKKTVRHNHRISADEQLLFFNGTLDYMPNLDGVKYILDHINPKLLAQKDFKYKIIICGKGLPAEFDDLRQYESKHIIYAGFVEDISVYFKAADIFINPVIDGGGIKTKLVEAIGYNVSAVSTSSGAFGVSPQVAGKKIAIVADRDWEAFADAILSINPTENTGPAFFNHFYWGNIAAGVANLYKKTS